MPPDKEVAAPAPEAFDAAFAEALAADAAADKPVAATDATTSVQDPPAGEVEGSAADAASTNGAADAANADVAAADAAAATAAATAAAAAEAAKVESPEAKMARLEAENAALREPKPKPAEAAPARVDAVVADDKPAQPAEPKWYTPTEPETAAMESFRKEWPDQAQAMDVMVKQAAYNVAEYVFNQLAKVYNPTLEKFAGMSDLIEEQLALMSLRTAHSDYDTIHSRVEAWVETLPGAYKRGAKQVMESGTSQEVSDLINEYKAANPVAAATASAAAAVPASAQSTTELSAAAKKAAGKLQVVGSKRTSPIAPADASDFDGAWNEALRVTG